jgi:hypothetical protein
MTARKIQSSANMSTDHRGTNPHKTFLFLFSFQDRPLSTFSPARDDVELSRFCTRSTGDVSIIEGDIGAGAGWFEPISGSGALELPEGESSGRGDDVVDGRDELSGLTGLTGPADRPEALADPSSGYFEYGGSCSA